VLLISRLLFFSFFFFFLFRCFSGFFLFRLFGIHAFGHGFRGLGEQERELNGQNVTNNEFNFNFRPPLTSVIIHFFTLTL
jgi:hypothetical protein